MTTIAKLEANRRNALESTGPRTLEGKVTIGRNAVRHGLTTAAVVIPGETEGEWLTFLAGIVESLQPVGVLEDELVARVAGLLWRLRRCQRYESAVTAADIKEVTTDDPMTDTERFNACFGGPKPRGFRHVRDACTSVVTSWEKELKRARRAARWLARFDSHPDGEAVQASVARAVCRAARETAVEMRARAPKLKELPRTIDRDGESFGRIRWTVALVRRAVEVYANACALNATTFVTDVRTYLTARLVEIGELLVKARRKLDDAETAIAAAVGRREARCVLPDAATTEKIQRHEAHIGKQLQLTLNQLERVQALRAGRPVAPPAAGTLTVLTDPAGRVCG